MSCSISNSLPHPPFLACKRLVIWLQSYRGDTSSADIEHVLIAVVWLASPRGLWCAQVVIRVRLFSITLPLASTQERVGSRSRLAVSTRQYTRSPVCRLGRFRRVAPAPGSQQTRLVQGSHPLLCYAVCAWLLPMDITACYRQPELRHSAAHEEDFTQASPTVPPKTSCAG